MNVAVERNVGHIHTHVLYASCCSIVKSWNIQSTFIIL